MYGTRAHTQYPCGNMCTHATGLPRCMHNTRVVPGCTRGARRTQAHMWTAHALVHSYARSHTGTCANMENWRPS